MTVNERVAVVDLIGEVSELRRRQHATEDGLAALTETCMDAEDRCFEKWDAEAELNGLQVDLAERHDKDLKALGHSDFLQWGFILATMAAAFSALGLVLLK